MNKSDCLLCKGLKKGKWLVKTGACGTEKGGARIFSFWFGNEKILAPKGKSFGTCFQKLWFGDSSICGSCFSRLGNAHQEPKGQGNRIRNLMIVFGKVF